MLCEVYPRMRAKDTSMATKPTMMKRRSVGCKRWVGRAPGKGQDDVTTTTWETDLKIYLGTQSGEKTNKFYQWYELRLLKRDKWRHNYYVETMCTMFDSVWRQLSHSCINRKEKRGKITSQILHEEKQLSYPLLSASLLQLFCVFIFVFVFVFSERRSRIVTSCCIPLCIIRRRMVASVHTCEKTEEKI